jgi:hypothetical protein
MTDERQSWRKAFEMIGPAQLRLRLEHRRLEMRPDYAREAEVWLLEKDAEAAAVERKRYETIRSWAIIAGIADVLAAIAGWIVRGRTPSSLRDEDDPSSLHGRNPM